MAETIEIGCDGTKKWMWFNVANDLEKQGGLTEVLIDPLSVCASGCGGEHEKNHFYITWIHDLFLLVTMQTFSQALVDAFSKVVEYNHFVDTLVKVIWKLSSGTKKILTQDLPNSKTILL